MSKIARITNDKEIFLGEEIIEYPPELEGGRNLLRQAPDGRISNIYRDIIIRDGVVYWTQIRTGTSPFSFSLHDKTLKIGDFVFSFKTDQIQELRGFIHTHGRTTHISPIITEHEDFYHVSMVFQNISVSSSINFYGTNPFEPPKEVQFWDFKLEKGSTPTDWTPSPEDLGLEYPDFIKNFNQKIYPHGAILTPEIIEYPAELEGGRNLFSNDARFIYLTGSDRPTVREHIILPSGFGRYTIIDDQQAVSGYTTIPVSRMHTNPFQPGTLTVSCDVRTNSEFTMSTQYRHTRHTNIVRSTVAQMPNTDEKWSRISFTIEFPDDGLPRSIMYLFFGGGRLPVGSYIEYGNFKLEKGNKTTDWTPAPEDLGLEYPDNIQSFDLKLSQNNELMARELIEYPKELLNSGRNLLTNSTFKSGRNRWVTQRGDIEYVDELMITSGSPAEVYRTNVLNGLDMVTVSVWVKGEGRFQARAGNGERVGYTSFNNADFKQVSSTFTDMGNSNLILMLDGDGLEVERVKLEKGNKATDWTPAPEDLGYNI